jgi:uncharacterized LabA/DUF88 family protein
MTNNKFSYGQAHTLSLLWSLDTTPAASAQGARPRKRPLLHIWVLLMKTIVYIDGFNLYFGALKATPYRWLDLTKLCKILLPKNEILEIKYFTALVKPRPHDAQQPIRQQTYLRALKTIENLSIIYGHFLSHEVMMPKAGTTGKKPEYVKVIKTEEKGSDVNIATHLLNDAYHNQYDVAVIVSNDSDLIEPIKIVIGELMKGVGIINPHKHPSRTLLEHATFFKSIRTSALVKSQFPSTLTDEHGEFHKPQSW